LSGLEPLLNEARGLITRSRVALAEMPAQIQTPKTKPNTRKETAKTMSTELTAQRAGELYASGMSVIEVAREHNLTYSKVRKLIADSGTPIRDASARLKGRTRKAGA
jgi:hypothetical protein